jgi:hypothetical protein
MRFYLPCPVQFFTPFSFLSFFSFFELSFVNCSQFTKQESLRVSRTDFSFEAAMRWHVP